MIPEFDGIRFRDSVVDNGFKEALCIDYSVQSVPSLYYCNFKFLGKGPGRLNAVHNRNSSVRAGFIMRIF